MFLEHFRYNISISEERKNLRGGRGRFRVLLFQFPGLLWFFEYKGGPLQTSGKHDRFTSGHLLSKAYYHKKLRQESV